MSNEVNIVVKSTNQSQAGLRSVKNEAEGLKSTFKQVATTAAGMLSSTLISEGASRLSDLFNSTVDAASNLNESMNGVQKIFGSSADQILNWGKKNAESFGLSQRAFNELAGPLGAGLKNAGLSMQDTSKWTVDLTKRAADMASVFNTSVPDALEAIQAGLRGEADPLERYGVGLSQAKVEAEALAETGKRTATSLSTQEIATARLNLIMKQTASTQGDFAQTSNQAANAQRIASAQIEDAKAKIGQGLLPVMAKVAQITGSVAQGFASMPGPLQATAVAALAGGAAFVLLAPRIQKAKELFGEIAEKIPAADTKMGALARTAGKVGTALVAMQAASAALGHSDTSGVDTATLALQQLASTGEMTSEATKHLGYDLGALADPAKGVAGAIENLTGLGSVFDESLQHATERVQSLDAALAQEVSGGKAVAAAQQFQALAKVAKDQGVSLDDLRKMFPQYQNALDGATLANKANTSSVNDNSKALGENAKQLRDRSSKLLQQRADERGFQASLDDATKSLQDNGRTLDINTAKGRSNQAALDQIASSTLSWRQSVEDAGGSLQVQNKIMDQGRAQLERMAERFGMTRKQAQAYVDMVLSIPRNVTTNIGVNARGASGTIDSIIYKLNKLNGKTVSAYVKVETIGSVAPVRGVPTARRTGGLVSTAATGGIREGDVLVGEEGPEILHGVASGSRISSYPDTMRMLAAGGNRPAGGTVVIEWKGDAAGLDFLRRMVRVYGRGDTQIAFGS